MTLEEKKRRVRKARFGLPDPKLEIGDWIGILMSDETWEPAEVMSVQVQRSYEYEDDFYWSVRIQLKDYGDWLWMKEDGEYYYDDDGYGKRLIWKPLTPQREESQDYTGYDS